MRYVVLENNNNNNIFPGKNMRRHDYVRTPTTPRIIRYNCAVVIFITIGVPIWTHTPEILAE